jgi:hypothetical protein
MCTNRPLYTCDALDAVKELIERRPAVDAQVFWAQLRGAYLELPQKVPRSFVISYQAMLEKRSAYFLPSAVACPDDSRGLDDFGQCLMALLNQIYFLLLKAVLKQPYSLEQERQARCVFHRLSPYFEGDGWGNRRSHALFYYASLKILDVVCANNYGNGFGFVDNELSAPNAKGETILTLAFIRDRFDVGVAGRAWAAVRPTIPMIKELAQRVDLEFSRALEGKQKRLVTIRDFLWIQLKREMNTVCLPNQINGLLSMLTLAFTESAAPLPTTASVNPGAAAPLPRPAQGPLQSSQQRGAGRSSGQRK